MQTTTLADLEKAVAELAPDDLARFRAWFEKFDAARFYEKIERDAQCPLFPQQRSKYCSAAFGSEGPGADIAARLQTDVWANCRRPEKHSLVLDITGPQPRPI
ncbi:MAG: hypothetical protein ABSE50_23840 [Xanthobacteraceae bacterium]|jgi:hypothetical protein